MTARFSIAHVLTGPAGEGFFNGFQARSHGKGSMICFGENDENGIFVVMSGKLRVYMVGEDREITLFYLVAGDIFCRHSGCLIEAVEPSELRVTDMRTFAAKMEKTPALSHGLISILGRAIISCMRNIEELMFLDIKQRVAWFFLDRANAENEDAHFAVKLSVDLTVEEIANLIGSSRQATSTAMNSLIKDGHLERHGRNDYIIPDKDRLKAAAATGRLSAR